VTRTCDNCGGSGACAPEETIAARERVHQAELAELEARRCREIVELRQALEQSRDHARVLEGQVSRLVEETMIQRRQLAQAAQALAESTTMLHRLSRDCAQAARFRVGRPVVGAGAGPS